MCNTYLRGEGCCGTSLEISFMKSLGFDQTLVSYHVRCIVPLVAMRAPNRCIKQMCMRLKMLLDTGCRSLHEKVATSSCRDLQPMPGSIYRFLLCSTAQTSRYQSCLSMSRSQHMLLTTVLVANQTFLSSESDILFLIVVCVEAR